MLIHVVNGPRLRGAERFAMELVAALAERNVRQSVCFLRGLEATSPTIRYCDMHVVPNGMSTLGRVAWLRKRLLSEPGAVVLCHGQGPQKESVTALLLSGRRKPFLAVKQIGMLMDWVKSRDILRLSLNRWLMANTDLCICLGPGQAAEVHSVLRVPKDKIVQIPNGRRLPASLPNGVVRDRLEILVVGALSAEKSPDVAIDVFCEIRKSFPGCRLTFAGDGPLRASLEQQVREVLPEGSVSFLGYLKDVWPLYMRAGVVVLCSRTEGVPGTVIESTLAGVPTVAWDVGDIGEVLRDGVNGHLTPFGDRDALVASLCDLLGTEDAWEQMCRSTREFAKSLSFDRIADSYVRALSLAC